MPVVTRLLVSALALVALQQSAEASIKPLPASLRSQLVAGETWQPNCPVPLSDLRVLTVPYWGFDRREHVGRLIVHEDAAAPLRRVFLRLRKLRFPIRHMALDVYRPGPVGNDVSMSFECRQAVPSPCSGGTANGNWSNHAYGLALDLNPLENPYVGCGASYNPKARSYMNRSRKRPGMVTPAVIAAFQSIGWEWGGSWAGSTKDYMHFSHTGH
jgi:hypothetical protein